MVVFLGGVTHAEVAALRFLQSQPSFGTDLLIATTDLINGTTLLQSLQQSVVEASKRSVLSQ